MDFKLSPGGAELHAVFGNGGLNSEIIFSTICLVFSWKVTYYGGGGGRTVRPTAPYTLYSNRT